MLVTLNDILPLARQEKRAVGGFNVNNYETLLAVIRAADQLAMPVIVQFYSRLADNGHVPPLAAMARVLAENSKTPVVIHLDHGSSLAQVELALNAGCTSVMLDASQKPFAENVALVRQAVTLARNAGASIESEIGHVPMGGSDQSLTTVEEAAEFYNATQIDALAVSIGTAHGFYKDAPKIDVDRAKDIAAVVPIPLVLHGGSGTPRDKVRAVIDAGVAKVNIATEFLYDYQQKLLQRLLEAGDRFIAADLLQAPVVDSSTQFIMEQMRFLANK